MSLIPQVRRKINVHISIRVYYTWWKIKRGRNFYKSWKHRGFIESMRLCWSITTGICVPAALQLYRSGACSYFPANPRWGCRGKRRTARRMVSPWKLGSSSCFSLGLVQRVTGLGASLMPVRGCGYTNAPYRKVALQRKSVTHRCANRNALA